MTKDLWVLKEKLYTTLLHVAWYILSLVHCSINIIIEDILNKNIISNFSFTFKKSLFLK